MTHGPIAYLTSEYPKVSHTFISREIEALRARGIEILPCTIRRADAKAVVGADQEIEAARTFGVIETGRNPLELLGAHLFLLRHRSLGWFEALALAWRTRPPGVRGHLSHFFYFLEAGVLARYLLDQRAVLLHNHFASSSCTVAMLSSVMSGIPFSFTEHGPDTFFDAQRWKFKEKVARAVRVMAISDFCRSQLMFFSDPKDWPKIAIVHCGVDPAQYGKVPHGPYKKRVLFVGRLEKVKGVPLLVKAFAMAHASHPDATLDIVGDGPARMSIEEQVVASELSDSVRFHGYLDQFAVARLMESVDTLVLPSFAEGLPVVLMEAMASRIPVVASSIAGIPELIEDGVSGFLVPPGDVGSVATKLEILFSNPKLCADMGHAGRSKVEAEHDIRKEVGWLAELFSGANGIRPNRRA